MSALGHERTYAPQKIMSGFTPESGHVQRKQECPLWAPKADIRGCGRMSTKCQKQKSWLGTRPQNHFGVFAVQGLLRKRLCNKS
jgi:hypothetical protein